MSGTVLAGWLAMTAASAHAGPVVSGYLQTTTAQDDAPALGLGGGVRVGVTANLLLVRITPEAGLGLYETGVLSPHLGAQLRVGKILEPGAYAHYWASPPQGVRAFEHGWDAGLALDLTAIPKVDVGAHVGLIHLLSDGVGQRYHTLGGHATFAF